MRDITADTVIDGRYQVIGKVGSGGMAEVYGAEDLQLGRKVAVKVLHQRFTEDEEFVERFRREAQSAAGLQHQHVVSVYDRGEWDGTYYIAMEFLEGRSLKDLLREEGPLEPLRALDIAVQLLRAARFAHRRGIIHRDLKPHNVILDEEDRAKVTDFGIARAGASDMTETGSIMGTAQYLSPEQAQGHAVSAQSDLYAIGIVLYEMLTGQLPFDAESAVTIALKQVSEPPPPPSELRPEIPPELEAVMLRALEKDPAQRFQDADEFIAALEGVRAQLTGAATAYVLPPPPPASTEWEAVEEPEPPQRRRRWLLVLAGLMLAALVVAALLLTGGPSRVAVPDVVGADLPAAQQRLRSEGFDIEVTRTRNRAPADRVIGQDPSRGAQAPEGSTVNLTVSAGPGEVAVPDVTGDPRDEAVEKLEDDGFEVDVQEAFSAQVAAGRVIETRPGAGVQIEPGSRVTLVVSRGQQTARVPSVVGRTEAAATRALRGAGFSVARQQTEGGGTPGSVVGQDPAGGSAVPVGATVTITVATTPPEPEQVTVPGVVGLSESEASERLSASGFQVDIQQVDVERPSDDGTVIGQNPDGGAQAEDGATVSIVVGRFDQSGLDPDPDSDEDEQPDQGEGDDGSDPGGSGRPGGGAGSKQ